MLPLSGRVTEPDLKVPQPARALVASVVDGDILHRSCRPEVDLQPLVGASLAALGVAQGSEVTIDAITGDFVFVLRAHSGGETRQLEELTSRRAGRRWGRGWSWRRWRRR